MGERPKWLTPAAFIAAGGQPAWVSTISNQLLATCQSGGARSCHTPLHKNDLGTYKTGTQVKQTGVVTAMVHGKEHPPLHYSGL